MIYKKVQEGKYIATLSGSVVNSGKSILSKLFNLFWEKANGLGANSFRVEGVKNVNDTISVNVSVFYIADSIVEDITELYPNNMVYVIGDIDKNKKAKRIKFNKVKVELDPLEYLAYQNEIGEKAILSIGGFLGAKVWIKGKEDKLPQYFSLSGFGVGPGITPNPGVGINFNTGRIHPVDMSFGQFLIVILNEKQ